MTNKKTNDTFVKLDRKLLNSPSWRLMSINCKRLIDFLMEEHLSKGGKENGQLFATYDQLVQCGISRRLVHRTITEAESLGLIRVERGGRKGCVNHLSKFMLTFLFIFQDGRFLEPSNDWKKATYQDIVEIQKAYKIKSTLRYDTFTVRQTYNSQYHSEKVEE